MTTHRIRTLSSSLATVAVLALAVAICTGGQDQTRPDTQEQKRAAAQAGQRDLLVLEAEMKQLQDERAHVADELERTRSLVRMLQERLRDARLQKAEGEEVERVQAEHDNNLVLLEKQEGEFKKLSARVQELEMHHAELAERIDVERNQREQAVRVQELQAAEQRRADAEKSAMEIYRDVSALAQQPDSAKALKEALRASEVQQLQAQYAGVQERLAQLEQLYQKGAISQTELTDTKTQAATLLAEMRQATIRSMIDQVETEREGYAQRNDPLKADVTGNVLQTEFFRGYLDTVQRYSELSREPADAAVAAVVTAADLLRAQGPQASIEYFKPILAELEGATDDAARAAEAAVRMQLAEAYHTAGQDADALEVLRPLIIRGAPRKSE